MRNRTGGRNAHDGSRRITGAVGECTPRRSHPCLTKPHRLPPHHPRPLLRRLRRSRPHQLRLMRDPDRALNRRLRSPGPHLGLGTARTIRRQIGRRLRLPAQKQQGVTSPMWISVRFCRTGRRLTSPTVLLVSRRVPLRDLRLGRSRPLSLRSPRRNNMPDWYWRRG